MTNPVIDSIRLALGRTAASGVAPRPPVYPARAADGPDQELARFLAEVKLVSGSAQQVAAGEIASALQVLVQEQQVRKAVLWQTPGLTRLGVGAILGRLGVELVSPHADKHTLATCDLGVTEADFALPETGTIALRSSAEKPRAVSVVPRVHLALVAPSAFRADLHQVFAESRGDPYLVFITGPSRTSDIELVLTLGVHGPKNLHVWVTDMPAG